MKSKLSLVLLLIAIGLIVHSTAADPVKAREKRSPKPQFGKLIGTFIARWISQLIKQAPKVVKLTRQVGNWVNKNPGTAAAGAAVVGVGVIAGAQTGQKKCAVYIKSDLPELQPVFIKDGTPRSLLLPTNGYLNWAHGETSTIACPGNYIEATYTVVETITCDNGFMFQLNGRLVDIRTIECHQKVTGNYQLKSDPQCPGTNRAIGFNVPLPTGDQFFDLFYSCFDDTRASALFTHHVIFGSEIDHKCIYRSGRPDFKSTGFPAGFTPASSYTQTNQPARLADLFNVPPSNRNTAQSDAARYFAVYLQRGHLTPDADELFTTWQWSTYFFINVAPMWAPINTGNWKNLETKVRKLAIETKENLEIYTGTYGTLQLCSSTNYCPEFTLENGGIPVPAWLWKIVKSPTHDAAIALVVSNIPFNAVTPICGSTQQDFGWSQNGFDNFQIGTVSYCTVQDLKNVVGFIPQAAMASNVLAF